MKTMDPTLISLFGYDIKWYSVLILLGATLAVLLLMREGKRFNISKDFLFNMAFWVIIFGIVGARLYYCIFNFSDYKDNPIEILYIWNGGLAIHGGILAGLLTMFLYCKKYNVSTFKMADMTVVPLLFAQAIGRWGNFFNSEAHGSMTTYYHLKDLKIIPEYVINGMKIDNVYYHPTFYYESLYCFVGFIILLFLRRYRYLKRGQLTCIYLMYYSVGRFFIEAYRTDSLMFGGFKMAQIISVALFIIGLMIFMVLSKKGRFEDLYNEDQKGPIRF